MKFIFTFITAAVLYCTATLYSQTVPIDYPYVVLGASLGGGRAIYHQNWNRTLSSDTVYYVSGTYLVDSLRTLTIPAGTIIRGDTASSIIINRGAKIYANGTVDKPVIMTSYKPVGSRARGDWGGLIICGMAPINQFEPLIEGGNLPGSYGGTNPDDNSGVLTYVRCEFPGYRYAMDNEINGITFCGVGRGTVVDHCQVSYSFDDSYEWFGGTVDVKHLVAIGGTDDSFDTDFGYQGRGQWLFMMRDPNIWDPTGQSNGFESDNQATPSIVNPRTRNRFSNVTDIGPGRTDAIRPPAGHHFEYSDLIRRGSEHCFYNSVQAGYPGGLALRDTMTWNGAHVYDSLQIRTSNIACWDGVVCKVVDVNVSFYDSTAVRSWYNTAAWGNWGLDKTHDISELGFTDLSVLTNPNPSPTSSSILATAGTKYFWIMQKDNGGAGFFDSVSYRGAFAPATPMSSQWTAGWTNFNPQNTQYTNLISGWNLISVPVTPSSYDAATLFPGTSGTIYTYNGVGYDAATTLVNGKAYWAFCSSQNVNSIVGSFITGAVTVTAPAAGWVLVGGKSAPVATSSVTTTPSGLISGDFYAYNGVSYVPTTQILPGKGYWVYVSGACTITLP